MIENAKPHGAVDNFAPAQPFRLLNTGPVEAVGERTKERIRRLTLWVEIVAAAVLRPADGFAKPRKGPP